MAELTRFDVTAPLMNQWSGEWHGLESRVRELELMINHEVRFGGLVEMRYFDLMEKFQEIHADGIDDAQRQERIRRWRDAVEQMVQRREEPATNPVLNETSHLGGDAHRFTHANVQKLFQYFYKPGEAEQSLTFDQVQIRHLRHFVLAAAAQILDFYNIFPLGFADTLVHSAEYPPIHVNAALMRQLSTDLHIGEQALIQRRRGLNREVTWQSFALYLADLMAYTTVQPLQRRGIIPAHTKVVTYMQRRTNVRLVPYFDMIFIGLPSSMANVYDKPPRNFLAIPHEIGHFLYNYGTLDRIPQASEDILEKVSPHSTILALDAEAVAWRSAEECRQLQPLLSATRTPHENKEAVVLEIWEQINAFLARRAQVDGVPERKVALRAVRRAMTPTVVQALAERFTDEHDWRAHWLEEIFADTFGCLIAGPYNVLGFQELLAEANPDHQLESDGKHPTAALRPLLQTEILRQIDARGIKSYKQVPDLLDAHWQLHLNNQGPQMARGNVLDTHFVVGGVSKSGEAIRGELVEGIGWVLDLFAELLGDGAQNPARWNPWSRDVQPGIPMYEALQQLRNDYDAFYFRIDPATNQPKFQRDGIKPPPPPADDDVPQTPYQRQVERLVRLIELKKLSAPNEQAAYVATLQGILAGWQNNQPFDAAATFPAWEPWKQSRIQKILALPKEGSRLINKLLAVLKTAEQRFSVDDWIGAFDVAGWTTEGPDAADDQ